MTDESTVPRTDHAAVSHTVAGDDMLLPFQLERARIRGRVARLDATLETILDRHRYPGPVSSLVAEAAIVTALVGQAIKLRWRFSIQIRGAGPVRLIATDYFAPAAEGAPARIRAYAGFNGDEVARYPADAAGLSLLGDGVMGVTIDQGPDMRPYQGITPLAGGSISECAETYFAQSEQLATRFLTLAARSQTPGDRPRWRAAGIMLQLLPEAENRVADAPSGEDGLMSADDVAAMGTREEDWTRVNMLLSTAEAHELLGPHVSQQQLLLRLFHEEQCVVFAHQPVRFGCTCSAARVEAALAQYSAKDIARMTTEAGDVTADCQFCSAQYRFDPKTLGFEAQGGSEAPGGG